MPHTWVVISVLALQSMLLSFMTKGTTSAFPIYNFLYYILSAPATSVLHVNKSAMKEPVLSPKTLFNGKLKLVPAKRCQRIISERTLDI